MAFEENGNVKNKMMAALLLAGGCAFGQVSIGIEIGPPPPPRVVQVLPVAPGPDFVWVEGYWYPVGHHYKWHPGYWTRVPYPGAHWVVPRYEGGRYFPGYWDGDRGRVEHDHHWDHDRDRDFRHGEQDHGRGRGHGRD